MKEKKKDVKVTAERNEKIAGAGKISIRGRKFKGKVVKKFVHGKRVVIEFERMLYVRKYERYAKAKTKIHARLPEDLIAEINVGDYIEVGECRPLSKIVHFIVLRKISKGGEKI